MGNSKTLKTIVGKIELSNPVIAASGTFGPELAGYVKPSLLGAIVTRSVTLLPQNGPPSPRLVETASGLLGALDLQSDGIEGFIQGELPFWRRHNTALIVSLAGRLPQELGA